MEPRDDSPRPPDLQIAMARALADSLARTLRVFRRLLHEEAKAHELTQAQYNAMRYLMASGDRRMSDLAAFLELTNGATTSLIERIEARGLVTRKLDPEDGRAVLVSVTPDGQRLGEEMRRNVEASLLRAFERLKLPERHMAVGGLEALADALDQLA